MKGINTVSVCFHAKDSLNDSIMFTSDAVLRIPFALARIMLHHLLSVCVKLGKMAVFS